MILESPKHDNLLNNINMISTPVKRIKTSRRVLHFDNEDDQFEITGI